MFDPLSWAIGYALTTGARTLGGVFSRKRNLDTEILSAARKWAATLPTEHSIIVEALFPRLEEDADLLQRPALRELRSHIRGNLAPTLIHWHQALIEQWQTVQGINGSDLQPFFKLPESEARPQLRDLAVAIVSICEQDEPLFKGTVLNYLRQQAEVRNNATAPPPFDWTNASTIRDVALAIEQAVSTTVHVIALDEDTREVHIWTRVLGTTMSEIKRNLLAIACILCGIPKASLIVIGISKDANDLAGSDGRGAIGLGKIVMTTAAVHPVALSRSVPVDFWEQTRAFILVNDNTPAQDWHEVPFRRFEEIM
jgi:hypothetical protein